MAKLRRKFTREQKLELVKESLEADASISELAERYKVHPNSIYRWRMQYLKHDTASFPGNGNSVRSAEEQQIERLKKQLREAELEKEILKKALGIFSSPNSKSLLL